MGAKDAEQLFDALRLEYLAQLPETLATFETQILTWPEGGGVSDELLRDVHSLKGTAGTYGLGFVTKACHHLEDLLSKHSRSGDRQDHSGDHQDYIDGSLRYVDLMREYVASVASGGDRSGAQFAPRLDGLASHCATRPVRVLIVESALSMSHAFRRLLDSRGIATSTSRSGYEALGQLVLDRYDAVLTSYETADISGLSLAKAARAIDEISPELKVILVTSNELENCSPAVNRVVRKDRSLEASLIETLKDEGLLD